MSDDDRATPRPRGRLSGDHGGQLLVGGLVLVVILLALTMRALVH